MENWQVALLTISAILVGALVPAIVQFQLTLRSLKRVIEGADDVIRRVDRVSLVVERHSDSLESFLVAIGGVSDTLDKARTTLSWATGIGAALGPVVAATVSALKTNGESSGGPGGA